MLDMTLKDIERVLYFEHYVVIEPGLTPLKQHQLLTGRRVLDALPGGVRRRQLHRQDRRRSRPGPAARHRPAEGSRPKLRRGRRTTTSELKKQEDHPSV
jgi:DNA-directed RNA polymerase beta' subunit